MENILTALLSGGVTLLGVIISNNRHQAVTDTKVEELTREGLLTQEELDAARRADPDRVDYAWLHQTRIPLLRRAWERGRVCNAAAIGLR